MQDEIHQHKTMYSSKSRIQSIVIIHKCEIQLHFKRNHVTKCLYYVNMQLLLSSLRAKMQSRLTIEKSDLERYKSEFDRPWGVDSAVVPQISKRIK